MSDHINEDYLHNLKEKISDVVHAVVDALTENLSEEDDDLIRTQLTEQFRFWRRLHDCTLQEVIANNQATVAEKYCDSNCTWLDHDENCQFNKMDINK